MAVNFGERYSPEQMVREQILQFNEKALELANLLDGEARRLKLEISREGEGYKISFQPMEWSFAETGEEKKKKKEPVEESLVEVESTVKIIGAAAPEVTEALEDSKISLLFSSNRKLSETPPSALLTEISLEKKNGEVSEGAKLFDLWVSLRDGIKDKADFQSYRLGLDKEEKWAGELTQVAELLGKVTADLRKEEENKV